jgi:hypothetical protein
LADGDNGASVALAVYFPGVRRCKKITSTQWRHW